MLVISPNSSMPEMDRDPRFPSVKSMAKAYRVFGNAMKTIDSVMATALHWFSSVNRNTGERTSSRSQYTTVDEEYNQCVDSRIRVTESRAIAP